MKHRNISVCSVTPNSHAQKKKSFLFYSFGTFVEKAKVQASVESSVSKNQCPMLAFIVQEFWYALFNDKRSV